MESVLALDLVYKHLLEENYLPSRSCHFLVGAENCFSNTFISACQSQHTYLSIDLVGLIDILQHYLYILEALPVFHFHNTKLAVLIDFPFVHTY